MKNYKNTLLATGIYLLANTVSHAAPPEPVLVYDFDESSITSQRIVLDQSGNNLHAVLADTDTYTSPGQTTGYRGSGLTFSGNSMLNVGDHNLLDLNRYTAMAWIRYQEFAANDGRQEVYEKVHSYWMNILKDSGRLRVGGIFGACIGANRKWIYLDSLSVIAENSWTHVAASYDGSTLKIYINGQLDAQAPVTGSVCDSDQPLTLGAKHHLTTTDAAQRVLQHPVAFMNGTIDEFRLFKVAISQSRIQQIMNQATGLPFAATVTRPQKGSTLPAPVNIAGSATAPGKVSQVLVGIKDNVTNQWWRNGSWGTWQLRPATISGSNASQTRADWQFAFDPRNTGGSGNYLLIVRVMDAGGARSDPTAVNFRVNNN